MSGETPGSEPNTRGDEATGTPAPADEAATNDAGAEVAPGAAAPEPGDDPGVPGEDPGDPGDEPPAGPSRRQRFGFVRRHKAISVLLALVLVLVAALGGWLFYLNQQLGNVTRFNAGLDAPGSPARVQSDALNILLVGVDNEQGGDIRTAVRQPWVPGVFRTDTMMILHIDADRQHAQLISIPRDSWVEIKGYGRAKINAAFSFGGPPLLVDTIQKFTGVHLDHVVITGFDGFAGIATAVGGVDVYVPQTVTDTNRDITWTKGTHHLSGEQALFYVRQRYGLPNGDFDRIARQQNFLRATLDKVASTGTLLNPVKITDLVGNLVDYVALDDAFTPSEMRDLTLGLRSLRPSDMQFATIPVVGYGTSSDGQSYVKVDPPTVRKLFSAVTHDDFAAYVAQHPTSELPDKNAVH